MPLNSTETGRRLIDDPSAAAPATSTTTDDPDGITAPFVPMTGLVSVATNRSPGRFDCVQIRCCDASANPEPAPISRAASRGAVAAGVVRGMVRVFGALLIRRGALAGAPVCAGAVSWNCGCAACA